MKHLKRARLAALIILALFATPACQAQTAAQESSKKPTAAATNAKTTNTNAYIALLRRDVRQEKAEIMGAMMALNAQDSAKFWPIYSEYDTQLSKLGDERIQNIKEYIQNYDTMTDEKADRLVANAASYQKQRAELLAKTYESVRQALGGVQAARFAMIEHQLLAIIDLQVASSLPLAGASD